MMERPDPMFEPLWGGKRRRRAILLPWFLWFFAIIGIITLVAVVSGCAAKPPCPSFQSKMIVSDDEDETFLGIWFDQKNSVRLAAAVKGLAEGTCTLAPPGTRL